jgi:hypothetical protein
VGTQKGVSRRGACACAPAVRGQARSRLPAGASPRRRHAMRGGDRS